jgi:hypothetical protein
MQASSVLLALVGFMSAVIGGLMQAWTARLFEREKFGRQARYDAYAAYFKAVGELSFADSAVERNGALAKIAEARGCITLYGSPAVISAMAAAFRHGSDLHSAEARPDHSKMIAAMRADVDPKGRVAAQQDLFELLYGFDVRGDV